jgi:hypothetical protein
VETSLNCLSAPKATMDAADVIPMKLFESRNVFGGWILPGNTRTFEGGAIEVVHR